MLSRMDAWHNFAVAKKKLVSAQYDLLFSVTVKKGPVKSKLLVLNVKKYDKNRDYFPTSMKFRRNLEGSASLCVHP